MWGWRGGVIRINILAYFLTDTLNWQVLYVRQLLNPVKLFFTKSSIVIAAITTVVRWS